MSSYNREAYLKFKTQCKKKHCDVCNIDLSYNAFANHMQSTKHADNVEKLNAVKQSVEEVINVICPHNGVNDHVYKVDINNETKKCQVLITDSTGVIYTIDITKN